VSEVGHIILTPSQPVFVCYLLKEKLNSDGNKNPPISTKQTIISLFK
jgi:hypothetical protein